MIRITAPAGSCPQNPVLSGVRPVSGATKSMRCSKSHSIFKSLYDPIASNTIQGKGQMLVAHAQIAKVVFLPVEVKPDLIFQPVLFDQEAEIVVYPSFGKYTLIAVGASAVDPKFKCGFGAYTFGE